jgi:hypothetical protein
VHEVLDDLWREVVVAQQRMELREIAKDPAAHRDTTLMGERGLRYRYWTGKNPRKQTVNFCYSTTPNAAGYFLAWQETIDAKGNGKRERIRGYKLRREAKESALNNWVREKNSA